MTQEERAAQMAKERRQIAVGFYHCLCQEASLSYQNGKSELGKLIRLDTSATGHA